MPLSPFDALLEEYLGEADAISDIRVVTRCLWFYDFDGDPVRMWQGQGRLFTEDGNEWLGTIDGNGVDHHKTPRIQDGRDGTSAAYNMTLTLHDLPGEPARETYEKLKAEQWRVAGRKVTCYRAIFKEGEALRPVTPIAFFRELTMQSPKFSEKIEFDPSSGMLVQRYSVTVTAKDGNLGRSNVPNGTYADTIQKQRAKEKGVPLDRGAEYLALLANRTYQIP